MYKIGVLGCNGDIGSLFLEKVSESEDNYIYAVARNDINLIKKDNIEYMIFDVENDEKINDFVSKCQLVVNCTGINKLNIINICIENDVNYVDPSFIDIEAILKKTMGINDTCIICSAGCNPGLTEVLTKYISIKYNPKKFEIIFSGNGSMSKSAVEELLDLSEEYRSAFRSFIKFENIETISHWDLKRKINNQIGEVICIPVINKSFYKCIKSTDIDIAYFYNTFKNEKIISKLIEAKFTIKKDNKNHEIIVNDLKKIFEEEKLCYNSVFTAFQCSLSHVANDSYNEKIILQSRMDWNSLTTVVLIEVITLLKHKKNTKIGIGEVWEMFDCYEMIDDFLNEGNIELKNIII